MSPYATAIAAARKASGLTLRTLSARMGISHPYYYEVERGRRLPLSSKRNAELAEILGLDAANLERLATVARGWIELSGLSEAEVGKVVRLVEKLRAA